ncbi:glycerophosphodiester phosphodiesterase family protein [Maritalea sp.]|uniref:glycerophosphodiester phosphodiesterase family protein n=1 Tax=Maritalea sp. TaxID=2003361 RepID=UPI003EF5D408
MGKETKTAANIVQKWRDPAGTIGEVFVTAHRGAFIKDNMIMRPENSVESIAHARVIGCDNVEIDVQFTKDGTAIVMHDDTLDRTTSETGKIADKNYNDLKNVPLVHPGTRKPFSSTIPTLEEIFLTLGDNMMVNVEIKTDISDIPKIADIAANAGVLPQVTIKSNQNDAAHFQQVADILGKTPHKVDFVPVLIDRRDTMETLHEVCALFDLSCVECVVDYQAGSKGYNLLHHLGFTPDGGWLFSLQARQLLSKNNIRQFINTLYVDPKVPGNHQWNGGRNCQLARLGPDVVYSFWIAHGASVIQTDEPEFVLQWLRSSGFRSEGDIV